MSKARGEGRIRWEKVPDCGGVIFESDDRIIGVGLQGVLHQAHQAFWLGLAIDDQVGPKEPMPASRTDSSVTELPPRGRKEWHMCGSRHSNNLCRPFPV